MSPTLRNPSSCNNAVDQYKLLAENNLWFDQINLLAQYRSQRSQEWTELLTSFGLQSFAQQGVTDLKLATQ